MNELDLVPTETLLGELAKRSDGLVVYQFRYMPGKEDHGVRVTVHCDSPTSALSLATAATNQLVQHLLPEIEPPEDDLLSPPDPGEEPP